MNNLERFKAVASSEATDYTPIFGFPGAPGMSRGCMKITRDQPFVTFSNLCKFMTLLHEVCNNPEGDFPRC